MDLNVVTFWNNKLWCRENVNELCSDFIFLELWGTSCRVLCVYWHSFWTHKVCKWTNMHLPCCTTSFTGSISAFRFQCPFLIGKMCICSVKKNFLNFLKVKKWPTSVRSRKRLSMMEFNVSCYMDCLRETYLSFFLCINFS